MVSDDRDPFSFTNSEGSGFSLGDGETEAITVVCGETYVITETESRKLLECRGI
ncbi:MAG: hypothetical protein U5N58_06625 [Actinomycetota bacterium]|nr:hypothetical protein [Actinomycetota bacterium]